VVENFFQTIATLLTSYEQMPVPPHVRAIMEVAKEIIAQTIGGSLTDRQAALVAFRRRTEQVRAAIPAERLLVFDVTEGWQPPCEFLEVPVPATAFPRLNSTEEWWKLVKGEPHSDVHQ
jgi:hypothetical protein